MSIICRRPTYSMPISCTGSIYKTINRYTQNLLNYSNRFDQKLPNSNSKWFTCSNHDWLLNNRNSRAKTVTQYCSYLSTKPLS
ncbi:hypothetical protein RRG08_015166 [Elysia crispata]|uniref:Uncharacterized protein n=1 Tax=Elysia crispata TaxID=231223 RepID=A0AAE1E7U2_9GAST|nr:hypothetical protein RRG08_015166 [Elysia crispata]